MAEILQNNIEFLSRRQRGQNVVKMIFAYSMKTKEFFSEKKKDTFTKRIGNTTYQVRVFFDKESTESIADKLMHLVNTEIAGMVAEKSIYE